MQFRQFDYSERDRRFTQSHQTVNYNATHHIIIKNIAPLRRGVRLSESLLTCWRLVVARIRIHENTAVQSYRFNFLIRRNSN